MQILIQCGRDANNLKNAIQANWECTVFKPSMVNTKLSQKNNKKGTQEKPGHPGVTPIQGKPVVKRATLPNTDALASFPSQTERIVYFIKGRT